MSNIAALSNLFESSLQLQASDKKIQEQIAFDKYSAEQQKQIHALISVTDNLPSTLGELNDTLRTTTYLLGTQEPTEIDSIVLARTGRYVAEFSDEQTAQNRHVVRWLDQVQHVLKVANIIPVKTHVAAEREIKQKPKKGESKESTPKPEAAPKAAKAPKEAAEAAAPAAAAAAAAGEAQPKKEKKEKAPKAPKAPKVQEKPREVTPGLIDLRVGFIEKAVKHPDADSLYVSTINVGEEEPRTICSGLVKFVPIEDMQKRYVVVVANLKPVKMRGIVSNGMVLCASTPDHTQVEFVNPPAGSKPGDKLFFETYDEEPETQLNPKKKVWEAIQPGFTTNDALEVVYNKEGNESRRLVNKEGVSLKAATIKNAFVS